MQLKGLAGIFLTFAVSIQAKAVDYYYTQSVNFGSTPVEIVVIKVVTGFGGVNYSLDGAMDPSSDPSFTIAGKDCSPGVNGSTNCFIRVAFNPMTPGSKSGIFRSRLHFDNWPGIGELNEYGTFYLSGFGLPGANLDLAATQVSLIRADGSAAPLDKEDNPVLKSDEAAKAEVTIVKSGAPPSGQISTDVKLALNGQIVASKTIDISQLQVGSNKILVDFTPTGDELQSMIVTVNSGNSPSEINTANNSFTLPINVMRLCTVEEVKGRSVPFKAQSTLPWGIQKLGGSPAPNETMKNFGCAVTSTNMVFEFYGLTQVPSGNFTSAGLTTTAINPGTFNTALSSYLKDADYPNGRGFNNKYQIVWPGAAEVARDGFARSCQNAGGTKANCVAEASSKVSYIKPVSGFSDANRKLVEGQICDGNPVILELGKTNGKSHFVVATGTDVDEDGEKTFILNNPGTSEGGGQFLSALKAKYPSIKGYRLYQSSADPSMLMIYSSMNTHFVVTDPDGRKTGFNPLTQTQYSEIPEASYYVESTSSPADDPSINQDLEIAQRHFSWTSGATNGDYSIELFGLSTGNYELEVRSFDAQGYSNDSIIEKGIILKDQRIEAKYVHTDKPASEINADLKIKQFLIGSLKKPGKTDLLILAQLKPHDRAPITLRNQMNVKVGGNSGVQFDLPARDFIAKRIGRETIYTLKKRNDLKVNVSSDGDIQIWIKDIDFSSVFKNDLGHVEIQVDDKAGIDRKDVRCLFGFCIGKGK